MIFLSQGRECIPVIGEDGSIASVCQGGAIVAKYQNVSPVYVALRQDGTIVIVDHSHTGDRLCIWTKGAIEATVIGDELKLVTALSMDDMDRIYVVERESPRIKRYDISSFTMSVIIGFFPITNLSIDRYQGIYLTDPMSSCMQSDYRLTYWV